MMSTSCRSSNVNIEFSCRCRRHGPDHLKKVCPPPLLEILVIKGEYSFSQVISDLWFLPCFVLFCFVLHCFCLVCLLFALFCLVFVLFCLVFALFCQKCRQNLMQKKGMPRLRRFLSLLRLRDLRKHNFQILEDIINQELI